MAGDGGVLRDLAAFVGGFPVGGRVAAGEAALDE